MLQADENLKLRIYNEAVVLQSRDTIEDLEEAKRKFLLLGDYKDSAKQAECCTARINKFAQKNERQALKKINAKRNKVIILVAVLVAIIALPCFYCTARSASSYKRIPVISANLTNNTFENIYKENDYFEFHANGKGYYCYYSVSMWNAEMVKDEFYWQVVIPLVGFPRVMITYQNSSRENFEFKIYTDGHDKPLYLRREDGLSKGLEYKLRTNR